MFAWLVLLSLAAIWGASYLFIRIGVTEGFAPLTFVAGRTLIAALALYIAMLVRNEKFPRTRAVWLPLILMAMFNGVVPYSLITWGETSIDSGLAAILTAMVPLFTVLIANFWTHDEKLTRDKIIGIVIGLVGVGILFAPTLQQGIKIEFWGMMAVVGATASYGFSILVARKFLGGLSHLVASTAQLGTAAAVMIPLSFAFEQPLNLHPSFNAIAALLTLALAGTAFAYILYYWLIHNIGATRTSLVTFLMPFVGIVWGALILHERLEWTAFVGLIVMVSGISLVNRAPTTAKSVAVIAAEGE